MGNHINIYIFMKIKNGLVKCILLFVVFAFNSCDVKEQLSFLNDSVIIEENKSVEQMRGSTDIPFSSACHSIFYYMRAGGMQDLSMAVKFSCNKDKVNEVLADIIKWDDRVSGRINKRAEHVAAPFPMSFPTDELSKFKWWDVRNVNIKHAVIANDGYACNFWITQEQGNDVIVYIFMND